MRAIGIDIGSSFVKAFLLDLETGRIVAQRAAPSPGVCAGLEEGLYEVPADAYVAAARENIDRWMEEYSDVKGVVLSVQMHGFVYRHDETSARYVSWQDRRCLKTVPGTEESYLDLLGARIKAEEMARAGVPLKPALGACNLFTLLRGREVPACGVLYTLGSYLIHALTGNNICHITSAAPLGIADVIKGTWDRGLIERFGFGAIELPELTAGDFVPCGFYRGIPVFPDYGDQQVSVLGCGPAEGEGIINIATAAQTGRITSVFQPGPYENRPFFGGAFLRTISGLPSGRNLDVLIDFFRDAVSVLTGRDLSPAEVWRAVHGQPREGDPDLELDMSFFGPRVESRGAITGISPTNLTLKNLFSSAYAAMSAAYRDSLALLFRGEEMRSLVCLGGVAWKTPALREAIGKTTGLDCRLPAMPDEAALGLLKLSLCCTGLCRDLQETERYLESKWKDSISC